MKLKFISDPGHGWLQVHNTVIKASGVAPKISSYSYQDRDFWYLEEDCDAGIFLDEMKRRGIEVEINEIYQENCHIRSLPRADARSLS